ncbi:hypothetical protein VUR80DRAFT_587 [Thermomyces stellatus]
MVFWESVDVCPCPSMCLYLFVKLSVIFREIGSGERGYLVFLREFSCLSWSLARRSWRSGTAGARPRMHSVCWGPLSLGAMGFRLAICFAPPRPEGFSLGRWAGRFFFLAEKKIQHLCPHDPSRERAPGGAGPHFPGAEDLTPAPSSLPQRGSVPVMRQPPPPPARGTPSRWPSPCGPPSQSRRGQSGGPQPPARSAPRRVPASRGPPRPSSRRWGFPPSLSPPARGPSP